MNESLGWTVGLGRWRGVRVRVHLLLLAFAVSVLWWGASGEPHSWAYGALSVVVLALSVWSREAARLWVARRSGSGVDEIVLWPMGGWLAGEPRGEGRGELTTALAPPIASGVLMTLGAVVFAVMITSGSAWNEPVSLTNGPVSMTSGPVSLTSGHVAWLPPSPTMLEASGAWASVAATSATAAALLAWVNAALLVINLLPVGSLDAGHALRALLRDENDARRSGRIMSRVALATAFTLGVLGWYVWAIQPAASLALWMVAVGMCRRDHAVVGSLSGARRCVAGTATVEHQARGCRPSDATAGLCRARGRVCGSGAVARCFERTRRHRVGWHIHPVAGGPKGTTSDGASDAEQNGTGQVDTLRGEVQRPGRGETRSVERARIDRAGIWRRRRRS
jgi:Zn-dependent protease